MRDYELTVLVKPSLTDKDVDKETKAVADLVTKLAGKIIRKDDPVKKTLAYEINHLREAYYLYFELQLPPEAISGLEKKLKISENVIRHLIIWQQNR